MSENEIIPRFNKPLTMTKYVVKQKKKFLWCIPRTVVKHYWVVEKDFSFIYEEQHSGAIHTLTVKKGFRTDLASVPPMLRSLFSVDGPYTQPAVLHDFLYAFQGKGLGVDGDDISKGEADKIFLLAMKTIGVPLKDRRIIYRAVQVGGLIPWKKCTDPKESFEEILETEEME